MYISYNQKRFHSISFPSEWGLLLELWLEVQPPIRFHSISFPSEWGLPIDIAALTIDRTVSIQLVSPASGDY